MARLDVAMRDRESFTETVLNWTVSASVAEAKKSLATMQAELQRLQGEEENWRKQHNHSRGNLQEAWDKLVQLRTHISLFRSAIEEATIEDVSLQAESEAWRVAHPDRALTGRVPLTVESAIKFGDVHGIREKLRLKEGLQRKVALVEELLADLRVQLSRHSTELTRVNTLGGSTYGSAAEAVGHSMVLRQAVISISQQLEDAEQDYLSARKELETVEIELSSILEKARAVGDAEDARTAAASAAKASAAEAARASHTEETLSHLVSAVLQGREPPPAITALTARVHAPAAPARCEFSLHEVLSGYARVTRLNGEEPRVYRARLEKRLSALMVLDQQLQDELLVKTEDVRRDRDRLREVEVLRLRVELQVHAPASRGRVVSIFYSFTPSSGPLFCVHGHRCPTRRRACGSSSPRRWCAPGAGTTCSSSRRRRRTARGGSSTAPSRRPPARRSCCCSRRRRSSRRRRRRRRLRRGPNCRPACTLRNGPRTSRDRRTTTTRTHAPSRSSPSPTTPSPSRRPSWVFPSGPA